MATAHFLRSNIFVSSITYSHSQISTPRLGHVALKFNACPTGISTTKEKKPLATRHTSAVQGKSNSFQCYASYASNGALTPELKASLEKFITSDKVVLFMKGTKDFPQCGFSNTVVQILKSLNVPFETFNILENEILRQGLKEYSSWPTFPQLYIDGEFFGGCDITMEAYQSGELQELLEKAMCS
ncbi:monothiol glutaredoxin-S7, chloroplastic [Cryptomeria japonica]|uniref:monothiol glutaredoxin-S7, chloroplastic n=1 Tax=Cryptomeria japonica TaxID=3369 RepID=UPI0027D9E672|nr:monothiol glutaredoxin-S7, chloroplastic [Cryptomeria japonica]